MTTGGISATRISIDSGNMEKDDQVHVPTDHVEDVTPGETLDIKLAREPGEAFFTDEEAACVKRKIDFIILPLLCGCYIFSVGYPCIETLYACLPSLLSSWTRLSSTIVQSLV